MNSNTMSGSERRSAKRNFVPSAFTRHQAEQFVRTESNVELIEKFSAHTNKHVQKCVSARVYELKNPTLAVIDLPVRNEFDLLVEKFKEMGKKNPEASARASLARRAQLKKAA